MNRLIKFFESDEETPPLTQEQKQSHFLLFLILISIIAGTFLTLVLLSLKIIIENKPYTTCFG